MHTLLCSKDIMQLIAFEYKQESNFVIEHRMYNVYELCKFCDKIYNNVAP